MSVNVQGFIYLKSHTGFRSKREILRKRETKSKASFMLTIETDEAVCEVSWDTLKNKCNHDDSCLLCTDVYWSIVLNFGTVWCSFEVSHETMHKLLTDTSRNGQEKRMLVSTVWSICEKTRVHVSSRLVFYTNSYGALKEISYPEAEFIFPSELWRVTSLDQRNLYCILKF
jgi:hypothetical protein